MFASNILSLTTTRLMHLSHCLFVALHNQFGMAQLSAHWHNSKTNDREREIKLQTETPMVVCLVQRMEKKGFEQVHFAFDSPCYELCDFLSDCKVVTKRLNQNCVALSSFSFEMKPER